LAIYKPVATHVFVALRVSDVRRSHLADLARLCAAFLLLATLGGGFEQRNSDIPQQRDLKMSD
jgi:hypothetical protein